MTARFGFDDRFGVSCIPGHVPMRLESRFREDSAQELVKAKTQTVNKSVDYVKVEVS
jgi:hypothetical protein